MPDILLTGLPCGFDDAEFFIFRDNPVNLR